MGVSNRTPADLVITPRNQMFGRGSTPARWWHGGRAAPTAFYNALSLTFPKGESFFIECVRRFRDEVSAPLAAQIGDFITQESIHSREHLVFNRHVRDAGYDLSPIEATIDARLAEGRDEAPMLRLASTVALEHFTAILAQAFLSDDVHFRGAPVEVQRLWKWHAIEEIEHKGVAFDTFMEVTADLHPFTRWKIRVLVMLMVTKNFFTDRVHDIGVLFKQDGVDRAGMWARLASYLFLYPGVLRRVFPAWLSYFLPNFHPWAHDDRALLRAAELELGLAATAA